jgi:uncharacterized RDD family membrane protein YckC
MEDILIDFEKPVPASKMMRWLASFIDYLIYALFAGAVTFFLGDEPIKSDGESVFQLRDVIEVAAVLLPWLVVIPGWETFNKGQTIGKAMFRIKAAKPDGSKIDIASSIVRHVFDFVDFLPFAGIIGLTVASNNKKAQRLGDLVAKTIVVET